MKKNTLIAATLVCVALTAGVVSAQTPVAGFSPNFADPQPATDATLTDDANRLIRWQGWLDVDAFSASILEQMQKQLGNGIEIGTFTTAEPAIANAVNTATAEAQRNSCSFLKNDNLDKGGEVLTEPTLYVWTYRHNYTDTGLYQLYVSVKGKMKIGKTNAKTPQPIFHKDIQSLRYEFGKNGKGEDSEQWHDQIATIEIWRGAVVRVNAKGEIEVVGNEAGVITNDGSGVEKAPIIDWERAPSLENNDNYKPQAATGAGFVEPLDREKAIPENDKQKAPGSVQKEGRVKVTNPFKFRSR